MTFPSRFPSDPYEGQCRDPLDRMVNLHKTLFEWVDISKEV